MGKWQIGTQVVAREGSILADGDAQDGIVGVGAGTFGIIVGAHATDKGLGGRFSRRLSVRFATGTLHGIGSDEVIRLDGPHGDVTALETANARVADAVSMLEARVKWRDLVADGRA